VATVKELFAIFDSASISLKWKDEEGDLISMSSDAELQEAIKASGPVLHLVMGSPSGRSAPSFVPAQIMMLAPQSPAPISTPGVLAFSEPPKHALVKGSPQWKEEKGRMVAQFKEQRQLLKEKMKALKDNANTDKKLLKNQIQDLRSQVMAHRQELKRMPKEAIMQARFVKDVTLTDGMEVAPGAKIVKTWRLRNESGKAWPEGTRLLWVGKQADRMGAEEETPVPSCLPGQEIDIAVPLVAPVEPGRYTAYFRLASPAGKPGNMRKFGQRLWASVVVYGSSSSDSEKEKEKDPTARQEAMIKFAPQLRALGEMGYTDAALNVRLLLRFRGNLEKAVQVLIKRQQRKASLPVPQTRGV